jgi:hypothetical protein
VLLGVQVGVGGGARQFLRALAQREGFQGVHALHQGARFLVELQNLWRDGWMDGWMERGRERGREGGRDGWMDGDGCMDLENLRRLATVNYHFSYPCPFGL